MRTAKNESNVVNHFKIALVGTGSMGREHARAFSAQPNAHIVALHNRTREKAETLAAGLDNPLVCDTIEELADRSQPDLIVVAVPELAANSVAKACFRHDCAVLLEKPAGYNLRDAQDIAIAAYEHKTPVFVGFNRRFYGSVLETLSDLDARPQEKRFIHVQDQQNFGEARAHNHPEEVIRHFMYANSIHNIDLITTFARGSLIDVHVIQPWRGKDTEVVLAHLMFDSGDTAIYEGIWQGPGPWACAVSTPSVRWSLIPLEEATIQLSGERTRRNIERTQIDTDYKPGFYLQAQAVLEALAGHTSRAVNLEQSLKTMELIHRLFNV